MKINKSQISALIATIAFVFIGWMSGYDFNQRNNITGIYTAISILIVTAIYVIYDNK